MAFTSFAFPPWFAKTSIFIATSPTFKLVVASSEKSLPDGMSIAKLELSIPLLTKSTAPTLEIAIAMTKSADKTVKIFESIFNLSPILQLLVKSPIVSNFLILNSF